MDDNDPISQFFDKEDVDLYAVLSLKSDTSAEDIRKSYRKLALLCHPDKLINATEEERANASTQFQRIGFAYTVLSDEKRRKKYNKTGKTDEGLLGEADEDGGWEAYFEDLFDRVTRGKLDEMKKEYQGSSEEIEDLKAAYLETGGSFDEIMKHIPHSTIDDEPRFVVALSKLVQAGDLPSLPQWASSSKDEKAKLVRKKQSNKEAKEAEELAKELGVWDEFYGSGKTGARKAKGKAKKSADDDDEEDTSALQALILKRQKNRHGFLDDLAAKYSNLEESSRKKGGRGRKRKKDADESEAEAESPKKKPHVQDPPDIDDEEFAKIQQRMFPDKHKPTGEGSSPAKGRRSGRAKKGK
ncbi:DnaJ-domain-containing protein [Suillus weaverae]|nr:DnaJ-domain-containing protein [Suillus weaverae]